MLLIGSHVSFKEDQLLGSAIQAQSYGANTFMFYTGAPQNTIRKPISKEYTEQAKKYMEKHGILMDQVVCHAPYIINLANQSDMDKFTFSVNFLKQEIKRCYEMGIKRIVLHPGSAVGITKEEGIAHIIEGINLVMEDNPGVMILLETMAGKGTECGSSVEEIKTILDGISKKEMIGVCLDTCHLHDAGYDMNDFDTFLEEFDHSIGLANVGCIHINDSKNIRASHKDRHENIGYGNIGFNTLCHIIYHDKLKDVPKILETPFVGNDNEDKSRLYPPYRFEIKMIQDQKFDDLLLEHIREFYK